MQRFEYQVVPAPKKGEKIKGAKTTADRFAHALTGVMNQMGAQGWDYIRADTLPCEERVGLTGSKTTFQHMLVFRRDIPALAAVPILPQNAAPAQIITEKTTPPQRREPQLSAIPAELFAEAEPDEVAPMQTLPKRDIAKTTATATKPV
jgi:hypothetical protein